MLVHLQSRRLFFKVYIVYYCTCENNISYQRACIRVHVYI